MPIFRVKSVKIYTGQKKFTRIYPWDPWQIRGMSSVGKIIMSGGYLRSPSILVEYHRVHYNVISIKVEMLSIIMISLLRGLADWHADDNDFNYNSNNNNDYNNCNNNNNYNYDSNNSSLLRRLLLADWQRAPQPQLQLGRRQK